ncbi:MAG: hypothetical protein GY874_01590 [Desulfobacteraceae bacterium]|nr:hypothetical protein [Desulfobacteraceae bacterium]
MLAEKLQIAKADPRAWHYNSEYQDEYAKQMASEYVDEKGIWQCPTKYKPNHLWDCSVLQLACHDLFGIAMQPKEPTQTTKPITTERKQRHTPTPPQRRRRW